MMISKISFCPPEHDNDLAAAYVTFDGVLTVAAAIYRLKNIPMKRSELNVQWPADMEWGDEYIKSYMDAEVLDRYGDFQDIHSKPCQLI